MVTDIADELVAMFKNKKIFKFLHLPMQSGDDGVLKLMHRCYNIQEFKSIVNAFRTAFSNLTLSTDIICGFPGETREAFENTLKLVTEVNPDIINVSKFFPRPKTAAALMQNEFLEPIEIKRRSTIAAQLARKTAFDRNQLWLGWTGEVLIDEKGKIPGTWIGRNFAYKPVAVKSEQDLLGQKLNVRIVKAYSSNLLGTITSEFL
jgi:threonylcarbamoyladenosine tRNA methylthiotransferase CDKAL1